jgi:hypothetical protein
MTIVTNRFLVLRSRFQVRSGFVLPGSRPLVRGSRFALAACALAALVGAVEAAAADRQDAPAVGVVRGVIVDAESGQPLAGVNVRIPGAGRETRTDGDGAFELAGLPTGPHTLVVSLVNYVLVRRDVSIGAGTPLSLTIPLTPGVGAYTEQVDVVAQEAPSERLVPASHSLDARDLLDLRGVAADDPFRAMQALPAVSATDDFHAEFAVRGSGPGNIGIVLDGVQSPMLVHTVRAVSESGSVALINSDVLERATLQAGSYPQRYGNRTGAQLDLAMRSGSRERTQIRGAVSGTGITFLAEGPLPAGRGSWLASFRKSYIDWLAQYVAPDIGATFGFVDGQGKVAFDLRPDQRLEFALVSGRSHAHDRDDDSEPSANGFEEGNQFATLATASWRLTRPRWSVTERVAFTTATYENTNYWSNPIADGQDQRASVRTDASFVVTPAVTLDAGLEAGWLDMSRTWLSYQSSPSGTPVLFDTFPLSKSGDEQGAFAQATLRAGRVWVIGGVRADLASPVDKVAASPWAQFEWPVLIGLTLRGGGGIFRQSPTLEQAALLLPGFPAQRQRAVHGDLSLEGSIGRYARWMAGAFVRDEDDMLRPYGTEYYLNGSVVVRPSDIPVYANAASGRARGFEVTVSRRDTTRLSGWLSYAYGHLEYTDRLTGEHYHADYDQRHTVNAYVRVGLSPRMTVSTRVRYGSNFPIAGYWEERDGLYYVGSARNRLRLPTYARVDARANRTFFVKRSRLTLFAEVLNVLGRDNVRQADPSVNRRTRQATGLLEELFPVLPSVGLLVEF